MTTESVVLICVFLVMIAIFVAVQALMQARINAVWLKAHRQRFREQSAVMIARETAAKVEILMTAPVLRQYIERMVPIGRNEDVGQKLTEEQKKNANEFQKIFGLEALEEVSAHEVIIGKRGEVKQDDKTPTKIKNNAQGFSLNPDDMV